MVKIEHQIIQIDGHRLYLRRAGAGGPPLVFVHGWGDSGVVWERSLHHWGTHFRCFALDQPGHGGSDPVALPEGLHSLAVPLARAIAQVATEPVTLVGHSLGGLVALRLALDVPQQVARLVLVNPAWSGRLAFPVPLLLPRVVGLPGLLLLHPLRRVAVAVLARVWARGGAAQREQVARWRAYGEASPRWLYGAMRLAASDISGEVGCVAQPTLVVVGPVDRTVPPRWTRQLARRLPHAQLAELPATGHHPMEDDFPAFARVVEPFLTVVG